MQLALNALGASDVTRHLVLKIDQFSIVDFG
jgi:hypothetical protein